MVVRLARPDERVRWDALVEAHHYLGFKRFAGRGLRYVIEWAGQWIALAGWQSCALKSRHRDLWVGWKGAVRWRRLHLIANNSRFVVLGGKGVFSRLGSFAMAAMLRRLSADWQEQYGHPILLAETFVDPARFEGTVYAAGNWRYLGLTRGFARHNGRYTDAHGRPKEFSIYPLRRDACRRLRDPAPLPAGWEPKDAAGQAPDEMRSLYQELAGIPDFRRGQGRKHTVASVLAVYILARLANMRGPVAAEYAQKLSQRELEAIGAWKNPKTGLYVPVSKSTLHRVIASLDHEEVEAALQRYTTPRLQLARAIAIDGKRIRGANRNGDGHFETATLVEHATRMPVATLNDHDDGGEIAAVRTLLEQAPVEGRVITLDALHTTRDTARAIVETHRADSLMSVKDNAPETRKALETVDWERAASGRFEEKIEKAHGRIEQRRIEVLTPLPRPRRFRARQQCHLHQPRARHHHPQDPVRKLRFRVPALRAAAPGRAHGAAVALNPAFPANSRLPVGEPARAPRSPPPRKSTPFAAPLDPANRAKESPAAALRGKHRQRSSGNSARQRTEAKTGQISSAARPRTAPKPFRFRPALRILSNPSAIHKNLKAWDTPDSQEIYDWIQTHLANAVEEAMSIRNRN